MSSAPLSRPVGFTRGIIFFFFLLAFFSAPHALLARAPQSPDAQPAPQQPASAAEKKDSPAPVQVSNASKPAPPKTHRVITDDDISAGRGVPIAPGARRRLKQLNRCDRACFVEVEKQALGWGYTTAFPRSTRQEMEDRLANDIEELRNDPKWQQLLLNMISTDLNRCTLSQNAPRTPEEPPSHTPTRQEILDEEERARNYRPSPGTDANGAGSAVLAYRFNTRPDPLRASFMVHQYMDELHQTCQVQDPPSDSDDDP
jgi:hypothetical protein